MGQSSDKYQNKDDRYVFLFCCFQKKSNRLTDLGKGNKSLNHIVYMLKLFY